MIVGGKYLRVFFGRFLVCKNDVNRSDVTKKVGS